MMIDIKVNIIDGRIVQLNIPQNATVFQVMSSIREKTNIDERYQRLIYLGKVLQKEKQIMDYNIHSGVCIQLVILKV
jgi:hypothetical protein